MELDRHLSALTRRTASRRVLWRLAGFLREIYAKPMRKRQNPWTTIDDFDGDLRFNLDRSAYIGSLIYWHGWHHHRELKFLRRWLHSTMVFADLGANQGEFTLFAAKRLNAGKVLAVEPSPASFQHLKRNVEMNGYRNVSLHEVALGAKAAKAALFTGNPLRRSINVEVNDGISSLFAGKDRPHHVADVEVRIFDELFRESGLQRLDLMKIDVEGAELPVLQGALNSIREHWPLLIIELSENNFASAGYTTDDVMNFLRELNYEAFDINNHGTLTKILRHAIPAQCNIVCQQSSQISCLPSD